MEDAVMKRQLYVYASLIAMATGFSACSGDGTVPVRKFKVTTGSSPVSAGVDSDALAAQKKLDDKRAEEAAKLSNKPPVLNAISDVHVNAGFSFNVVPRATEPDGEPMKYFLQCPVELGGPKESDTPFFSVSVSAELATQSATCAVIVVEQGQYLQKSELQQFNVNITGKPAPKEQSAVSKVIQSIAPKLCENLEGWAKTVCEIGGAVAGGLMK